MQVQRHTNAMVPLEPERQDSWIVPDCGDVIEQTGVQMSRMPACCHETSKAILSYEYFFQICEFLSIFLEKGKTFPGIRPSYTA